MRCRECESLLWAYIDDELPEAQRRALASHVGTCASCSSTYDELRAFPLQLGQLRMMPPPPDFTARLMQRIAPLPCPQDIATHRERARANGWPRPFGLLLATSVAAAAVLLGLMSTALLALASGRPLPSVATDTSASGVANAIGFGVVLAFWQHLSWPVVAALVAMLTVLAVLWVRVVAPQRWADQRAGLTPRRQR